MTNTTKAAATNSNGQITTNGWDTVFTTTYAALNNQISLQWPELIKANPNLQTIKASSSGKVKASVSLTFDTWKLAQGGGGQNVNLLLPINSGEFKGIDNNYDLAGSNIKIQLELQWVPQPGQNNFAIQDSKGTVAAALNNGGTVPQSIIQVFADHKVTISTKSTITVLTKDYAWKITDSESGKSFYVFDASAGGSTGLLEVYQYVKHNLIYPSKKAITPVVVLQAGDIKDGIDGAIFKELISKNIDENLAAFNFVFGTADIVTKLSKQDAWNWLSPTTVSYAVAELEEGATDENSVFGILSMVNNNNNPSPVQEVDIKSIPKNCDSSLLISPTLFLENLALKGVSPIFKNAQISNFDIDTDALTITNNTSLTWIKAEITKDKTKDLTVDKGDFKLSIINDLIEIQFYNLSYPIEELGITVGKTNIIFTGYYSLTLKKGKNKNTTLWFDIPQKLNKVPDVSTSMNATYFTIESIAGWLTIALSVVGIGAVIGERIALKAGRAAVEEAGVDTAEVSNAELRAAFKRALADPEGFTMRAVDMGIDDIGAINTAIKNVNMWTSGVKWIFGLALITGGIDGSMMVNKSYLEDMQHKKWDKTPAFNHFAELAIDSFSFSNLKTFEVESAQLAQCLQIGFNGTGS